MSDTNTGNLVNTIPNAVVGKFHYQFQAYILHFEVDNALGEISTKFSNGYYFVVAIYPPFCIK